MDVLLFGVASLGTLGLPFATAVVGAVMGSLLNATLTARAAKRELEEADQHDLIRRVHELEVQAARQEGLTMHPSSRKQSPERKQP